MRGFVRVSSGIWALKWLAYPYLHIFVDTRTKAGVRHADFILLRAASQTEQHDSLCLQLSVPLPGFLFLSHSKAMPQELQGSPLKLFGSHAVVISLEQHHVLSASVMCMHLSRMTWIHQLNASARTATNMSHQIQIVFSNTCVRIYTCVCTQKHTPRLLPHAQTGQELYISGQTQVHRLPPNPPQTLQGLTCVHQPCQNHVHVCAQP